jgi:hypothetical protein
MKWLLLLVMPLAAADPALLCRQGAEYFEAGEHAQAATLFEKALREKLTSRQQGIVRYDLGTARLASGDWQGALRSYDKVESDESELQAALQTGRARAHLMHARSILEGEDFAAKALECRDALLKGLEEETPVQEALKIAAVELISRWRALKLDMLTRGEAAEQVSGAISTEMQHLELIADGPESERLLPQLAKSGERLADFWERLDLREAENLHRAASERLMSGEIWKSRDDLAEAHLLVETVAWEERGADPIEEALKGREGRCARLEVTRNPDLFESLREERDLWSRLAGRLCVAQEESELLQRFSSRLAEPSPSLKEARADLWFYKALAPETVESLVELHDEVRHAQRTDSWEPRLDALRMKSRFEGEELVAEVLDQADLLDRKQLTASIEKAIRLLELRTWLKLRLTDLEERTVAQIQAPRVAKGEILEMKGSAEECLEASDGTGLEEDFATCVQSYWQGSLESEGGCRVCLEEAKMATLRAKRLLEEGPPTMGSELLGQGIDAQAHAVEQYNALERLRHVEGISPGLLELGLAKEERILRDMESFPSLLYAQTMGQDPHKKVLDLYDEGVVAGQKVLTEENRPEWAKLSEEKWREALNELEPPSDDESEDEQDDEDEQEEEEEESESPSQAFEWLQEMDREDERRVGPPPVPKKGLRPW